MRRPTGHRVALAPGLALAGAAAVALVAGCRTEAPPPPAAGEPVAVVNGVPISRAALQEEMRRSGKDARATLHDLIDFELLAAAAARETANDPDVVDARERAQVQRLIERDLEPRLGKDAIPDATLRQVYDKARSVFVHPRLVEIAMLSVYTGTRMKDEPRAQALATARELDAYVRARKPATPEAFEAIASEPAWRERKVKRARLLQALDEPFEAAVGGVVATLKAPGDTTPLITADSGYHIARYISERPPENVTFDEARPKLRDQIFERWRQQAFLDFAQAAAGPHAIEAYPERL